MWHLSHTLTSLRQLAYSEQTNNAFYRNFPKSRSQRLELTRFFIVYWHPWYQTFVYKAYAYGNGSAQLNFQLKSSYNIGLAVFTQRSKRKYRRRPTVMLCIPITMSQGKEQHISKVPLSRYITVASLSGNHCRTISVSNKRPNIDLKRAIHFFQCHSEIDAIIQEHIYSQSKFSIKMPGMQNEYSFRPSLVINLETENMPKKKKLITINNKKTPQKTPKQLCSAQSGSYMLTSLEILSFSMTLQ